MPDELATIAAVCCSNHRDTVATFMAQLLAGNHYKDAPQFRRLIAEFILALHGIGLKSPRIDAFGAGYCTQILVASQDISRRVSQEAHLISPRRQLKRRTPSQDKS